MGFSVSGSLVVVVLGLFVALATLYSAGANTMERIADAEGADAERLDRFQDTGVSIASVSLTGTCGVEVRANNTGSTTLSLSETSLLFNNTVLTDWRSGAPVDGDSSTDLWLPGEQLVVTRTGLPAAPDRVKLVTDTGVASTRVTEGLSC